MATPLPYRRDRYLYLGGPVASARTRARLLAAVATLIYAALVFGLVLLAHGWIDRAQLSGADGYAPALHVGAHRF
jgi:hypothetical protein